MTEPTQSVVLKDLSKTLEHSYQSLHEVIDQIGNITQVIQTLKNDSANVRDTYLEIFDHTKLKEAQKDYKQTTKHMLNSLNDIQDQIIHIQTIRKTAEDDLVNIVNKMKRFEKLLHNINEGSKSLDKKLSQGMEKLKLNHNNVERKADKALRLIEINHQVEKYDEIIRLQKENNTLLRKLQEKDTKPKRKPQ